MKVHELANETNHAKAALVTTLPNSKYVSDVDGLLEKQQTLLASIEV